MNETFAFNAATSRRIDADARQALAISGLALMQRAAAFAYDTLLAEFPSARTLDVWCGKGNNGGDAYLVAASAHRQGLDVRAIAVAPLASLDGDAALAAAEAGQAGVPVLTPEDAAPRSVDVVVDGILGTGLKGAPRDAFAAAIVAVNGAGAPVLAIDLPSGVDADTGAAPAEVVRAAVTCTFITHKIGLLTGAGKQVCGRLCFAPLGVPATVPQQAVDAHAARLLRWAPQRLSALPDDAYKHARGHVLVMGGDTGMPGAVALAAEAALRSGAGMVTVATHPEHAAPIIARTPEVMVVDATDAPRLGTRLAQADVVVAGPGLGREPWGEACLRTLKAAAEEGRHVVIDADGLFWLRSLEDEAWRTPPALYLTPHAAEAARLLDSDVAAVEADRVGAAGALAARYDAHVLLKGPGSVVHGPAGAWLCQHGNPGMATAGMGDVLSGIVGGLLAPLARAGADATACAGMFAQAVALHSAAADIAASELGERSLTAGDVIRTLPRCLKAS